MWFEASYPISQMLANYPGDQKFKIKQDYHSLDNHLIDDSLILCSTISGSLHFGTHTDAPQHFIQNGKSIDQVELDKYIGPCQVIRVDLKNSPTKIILPKHLPPIIAPRVLFATNTFDYFQPFQADFATFARETIAILLAHQCCLVGIDTPSVDPADSHDFTNHVQLLKEDIAIIEGLKLDDITEGRYEILAIPLAYENLEASPLRVLLRPL